MKKPKPHIKVFHSRMVTITCVECPTKFTVLVKTNPPLRCDDCRYKRNRMLNTRDIRLCRERKAPPKKMKFAGHDPDEVPLRKIKRQPKR